MSEFREDLLVSTINKKRIVKIILTAVLLVTSFAFSILLFSLLWGTQRPLPSDQLSEAENEDALLILPPFPYDLSDFLDLFSNLNLTQDQINEIIEDLQDLLDADIEDLDLNDFASLLLALMFSDVEVFRVYDYNDFNSMTNKLWKYECYDEFIGDGWRSSSTRKIQDFYSYSDYGSKYGYLDMLTIQMPLSPALGMNSLNIPTLFPTPFIMDGSVDAPNLIPGSPVLNIGSFNCTSLDLSFDSTDDVNMAYEMFGLDLPSDDMINNSAVIVTNPSSHYLEILSNFTQLPTDRNTYINLNPFFKAHYDNLFNIITHQDNDFTIANKIRNYFLTYFTFGTTARDNDPPGDTEDIVYWFSEHQEGLWSDIATAFSIFCRVFNVASRFVNGFNSEGIEEIPGENSFAIKYRNIYSWVEIYVPTDIYGNGNWVQIDIPLPMGGVSEYSITVDSNFTVGPRGEVANITATLISDLFPVDNKRIDFYDATMEQPIGIAYSDINGKASILIDIDDSQVVGPHVITASYQTLNNYTFYSVIGDIQVNLNNVNPMEVNRSIDPTTNIQGNVYDPIANQFVKYAELKLLLLEKGTNTEIPFNQFNPTYIMTDNYGDFNDFVDVDSSVPIGEYDLRVDFNGTWDHPFIPFPLILTNINDSSNRLDFSVTEDLSLLFNFWINGTTSSNYENPKINRNDDLNLTVYLQFGPDPISNGTTIEFYDSTQDNLFIGSAFTSLGYAQYMYSTNASTTAGPHLIYAKYGSNINNSYFILDEQIDINLDICPSPRVVNRSTSIGRNFLIHGYLNDSANGNPIKNGGISVYLLDGVTPVDKLQLVSGSYLLDETGEINLVFSVLEDTFPQNYTLRVDFNGLFVYPYFFDLGFMPNFIDSAYGFNDLKVIDPYNITIDFYIEGNPTLIFYNNTKPPERYNMGDIMNLTVYITDELGPVGTGTVTLTDEFTGLVIDTHTVELEDNGYFEFYNNTNSWHAGLHQIKVDYSSGQISAIKTTYVIINETVNIFTNPIKNSVLRGGTSFTVSGTVQESGELLRGLRLNIILYNSTNDDVSIYLIGSQTLTIRDDGYYEFVNSIDISCPQGEYYINITFTGGINAPGIWMNDFMVHNSSLQIQLNITAGVEIIQDTYYTQYESLYPDIWADHDTLYVIGNLTWDNGTALAGMIVNLTIKRLDGSIVTYNGTVVTDQYGGFNISLYIYPIENWPTYRVDSEIWVYFDPIVNYVEQSEEQYL